MTRKVDTQLYKRWRTHGASPEQVAGSLLGSGQPYCVAAWSLATVFDRSELWAGKIVYADFLALRHRIREPQAAYIQLSEKGVAREDVFAIIQYVYGLNKSTAKSVMLSAELARGNDIQRTLADALELFDGNCETIENSGDLEEPMADGMVLGTLPG